MMQHIKKPNELDAVTVTLLLNRSVLCEEYLTWYSLFGAFCEKFKDQEPDQMQVHLWRNCTVDCRNNLRNSTTSPLPPNTGCSEEMVAF